MVCEYILSMGVIDEMPFVLMIGPVNRTVLTKRVKSTQETFANRFIFKRTLADGSLVLTSRRLSNQPMKYAFEVCQENSFAWNPAWLLASVGAIKKLFTLSRKRALQNDSEKPTYARAVLSSAQAINYCVRHQVRCVLGQSELEQNSGKRRTRQ